MYNTQVRTLYNHENINLSYRSVDFVLYIFSPGGVPGALYLPLYSHYTLRRLRDSDSGKIFSLTPAAVEGGALAPPPPHPHPVILEEIICLKIKCLFMYV
jgi:hypothetical protein